MDCENKKASIAGLGYTIGNIILKGIVFFSLPVFTKLMLPEEFGIYNNYIAYETVFSAILGLGFYSTIKKANIEFGKDFNEYYSSITIINLIFFVLLFFLCSICKNILSKLTGFDNYILIILLCHSFGSSLLQIYSSYLNANFKYKPYLILSFINSISNILISVLLILFVFPDNSHIGRIIGTAIPYIIIIFYIIIIVFLKGGMKINRNHVLYGLKLGLPVVPHVISQFILNQSDRIIITEYINEEASGLYSYAYNICSILLVVLQSFDSAWTPWTYLQYANKKNDNVKDASKKMLIFSFTIYIGFICLSPDVYRLMANDNYHGGISMIIPLALSIYFLYLYFIPVNLEYYNKKTLFVSLGTILAAIINVVLNVIFIPIFGYVAAAFTTLISYFILFLIHIIISLKHNLIRNYNCKCLSFIVFLSLLVSLFFEIISYFTYLDYIIRYVFSLIDIIFIFNYFKKEIISFIKKKN